MTSLFARFIDDDRGQDIIEYALLAAFVAVCATGILAAIGGNVRVTYSQVSTALGSTGAGASPASQR